MASSYEGSMTSTLGSVGARRGLENAKRSYDYYRKRATGQQPLNAYRAQLYRPQQLRAKSEQRTNMAPYVALTVTICAWFLVKAGIL